MTHYEKMIVEATGCPENDAAEIEDLMRHVIFHSTLDWQTRRQFNAGARQAKQVLDLMRQEKGGAAR